jgi:hypothetical protein
VLYYFTDRMLFLTRNQRYNSWQPPGVDYRTFGVRIHCPAPYQRS